MKNKCLIAFAASMAAFCSFAEAETAEEGAEQAAEAPAAAAEAVKAPAAPISEMFTTLPFCRELSGTAQVLKPGASEWMAVEDGRFYPLGSVFKAGEASRLVVAFGKNCTVAIENGSSFESRKQPLGVRSRTIALISGTVLVSLPDNFPEGAFFVTTPGFTAKNPAGDSKYVYTDVGDGFEATVRCVTGSLEVEGRHFAMSKMRAANEFKIRCSRDNLETIIYGVSGDYIVRLDQGLGSTMEIGDSGERKEVVSAQTLEWHLTPETRVQINRAVPSIGEKMSVHTMAFDAAGTLQSERTFCEGRAEINSGELVVKERGDADELAKRAADATEEAAAEDVEESSAESSSEASGASKTESDTDI